MEKRFRFDETRRDNYLESGGTAGTGGEKDATHSVAEAGQAWTDDGVETRLDAGYHHRRSTRLEPTRVDAAAAAAAAATAAMPLSLSSGMYWRRGGDNGRNDANGAQKWLVIGCGGDISENSSRR